MLLNNTIGKYSSESGESSSVCGLDHETKTTKKMLTAEAF